VKRKLLLSVILATITLSACSTEITTTQTSTPVVADAILAPASTPTYSLSVNVSPSGSGSVSPPGGKYESGLQVTLTATPASGYTFDYWDGAASSSSPTTTIIINSNKNTTAHFKIVVTTTTPTQTPTTTPKPTQTPTTTPTQTIGYSRSNPAGLNTPLTAKVGSTGRAGTDYTVSVTVLQTIRGDAAWQMIRDANMFNKAPNSGYEYILVKIQLDYSKGATADTTYNASGSWFTVVSSSGKDYDNNSIVDPDPQFDANLYPSASTAGWVSFYVVQSDTQPLLAFARNYDGTGGIWFKLY
jgi:hypothetical protein